MLVHKLANANAAVVSVTTTARSLEALLDTAGSAQHGLPHDVDAVDLVVESGSIRYLADGNTPTTSKGMLLSAGTHRLRGVSLKRLMLISTSGTVSVGAQVGKSLPGEGNSGGGSSSSSSGITKARTSLYSAQTLTAGAGNTTSSWVSLASAYGAVVNIKLTNGATGPTVAAQVQIEVAADAAGTLPVKYGGALVGATANSGEASWSVELPPGAGAFRLVSGSNTAQNVTLDADYSLVTGV